MSMDDFKFFCCLRSIASFCGDYPVFEETSKFLEKNQRFKFALGGEETSLIVAKIKTIIMCGIAEWRVSCSV
jgi:hypothetical protein